MGATPVGARGGALERHLAPQAGRLQRHGRIRPGSVEVRVPEVFSLFALEGILVASFFRKLANARKKISAKDEIGENP
jgi:hypothetical protein